MYHVIYACVYWGGVNVAHLFEYIKIIFLLAFIRWPLERDIDDWPQRGGSKKRLNFPTAICTYKLPSTHAIDFNRRHV